MSRVWVRFRGERKATEVNCRVAVAAGEEEEEELQKIH